MIKVSICLTDIDKEKIKQASNGKKYLNLVLDNRKETSQFGETHTLYHEQTKEEREAKQPKKYVGGGKEFVFDNNKKAEGGNPGGVADDLPF